MSQIDTSLGKARIPAALLNYQFAEDDNDLYRYKEVVSHVKAFFKGLLESVLPVAFIQLNKAPMIAIVFALFGVGEFAFSQGLDPNEIYKFDPCYKFRLKIPNPARDLPDQPRELSVPPSLSSEVSNAVSRPEKFPAWGVSLSPYIQAVERINGRNANEKCDQNGTSAQNVSPLLKSLADVSRKTADLMVQDLKSQNRDMQKVVSCLQGLDYFQMDSTEPVSVAQFLPSLPDEEKARCAKMVNFLVRDLSGRQKRMRMYMALNKGKNPELGDSLTHDLPFTTFISSALFPVQAEWQTSAEPLNAKELSELPNFSRSLGGKRPADLYDQMISTTPVLLQIKGDVTPRKIEYAVRSILTHSKFNEKEFQENISQEMFLNTPYVAAAIQQLPENEQQNACVVARVMFDRLKIKYETSPRFLAAAALLLSTPMRAISAGGGAVASGVAKTAGGEFMRKAGWGMLGVSAVESAKLFKRYNNGMHMCTAIYRQRFENPEVDGICSLHKLNKIQDDAEFMVITSAGIFGAITLGRPALSAIGRMGGK